MLPNLTTNDSRDDLLRPADHFRNLLLRNAIGSKLSYLANIVIGEFGVVASFTSSKSIPCCVSKILLSRAIAKVADIVVFAVVVPVKAFLAFWARADKRQKDEFVNKESNRLTYVNKQVNVWSQVSFVSFGLHLPPLGSEAAGSRAIDSPAKHSSVFGDGISRKTWNFAKFPAVIVNHG